MKTLICITLLFSFIVPAVNAERPALEVKQYKIIPGESEVLVPKKRSECITCDNDDDIIMKKNQVHFDKKTGLYTYTYWKTDGTKVDLLHEQANRVDVIIKCSVNYNKTENEYIYKYRIINTAKSKQSVTNFVIDTDPELIHSVRFPDTWEYFSKYKKSPGSRSPVWTAFGSLGDDILPGKEGEITVKSKYGPVIASVYVQGRPEEFVQIDASEIEALSRHPPNKEGVTGKTLAPGTMLIRKDEMGTYLNKVLNEALRWGWISSAHHTQVSKMLEKKTSFSEVLSFFRDLKTAGSLEPELEALANHLERISENESEAVKVRP